MISTNSFVPAAFHSRTCMLKCYMILYCRCMIINSLVPRIEASANVLPMCGWLWGWFPLGLRMVAVTVTHTCTVYTVCNDIHMQCFL